MTTRLIFCIGLISAGFNNISPAAEPPAIYDSEESKEKPISGDEAVRKISVPEGFEARLFASEPMVRNPIALQYDSRGRLWIAENYTYAERGLRLDPNLRDRLVILEDTNADGKADKSTVFTDQLHTLTGFALGRGGVFAICPPQLLFIPDRDRNDKPDAAPVVLLDGFEVAPENHHNFANGLKFGPDGWLYGRCGGTFPGEIGQPGTPANTRIPLRGGIWRYHPQSKAVEVLTHGTTNPWGMDWDEHGEAFFTNTVNGHLWYLIPGSHLDRLHTVDPNPDVFQLMQQTADHFHFDTGQGWAASRDGAANSLGGGHAHQGAMIYQGGVWPEPYHGRLFTNNFHGRRINQDKFIRQGSGYVARHDKDFAIFGDTWFRGIDMAHTPDGNMMVIDWSDTGECHENTGVHRSSGRIYEIRWKNTAVTPFHAIDTSAIINDLKSANIYLARRALDEISDWPAKYHQLRPALDELLNSETAATSARLRSLWALRSMNAMTESRLVELCMDKNENLRAWALRFLVDDQPLDTIMGERPIQAGRVLSNETKNVMERMAKTDASGLVRLVLASTLQRLDFNDTRIALAKALVSRTEDAVDANLNLMTWYGIAPFAESNPKQLTTIAESSDWPLLNRMIARRLASSLTAGQLYPAFDEMLGNSIKKSAPVREAILAGMKDGLSGRDKVREPAAWKEFAATFKPDQMRDISVIFGDGVALEELRRLALDSKAEMKARQNAIKTLIARRPPDLVPICSTLLGIRYLNSLAIAGLAGTTDIAVARRIVDTYQNFAVPDRPLVIETLIARPAWAQVLLEAVARDRIPRRDLTLAQARRISSFNDRSLTELLEKTWGKTGMTSAAKLQFKNQLKQELEQARAEKADFNQGRQLYLKSCGQCHTLYGEGGRVGPDITGSQRQNLDYLMENVLEPSAVVSPDFRLTNLQMKDGRVLSGLTRPRDKRSLTLITPTQTLILDRDQVEAEKSTNQSIMPEGQLEAMSPAERVSLLKYLMTETPPAMSQADLPR